MNKFSSHLFDNLIEYTIGRYKHWYTPDQYKPFDPEIINWAEHPPEDFYAIPEDPPELTFEQPYVFAGDRVRSVFTFQSAYESPDPINNLVQGLADQRAGQKSRGAVILVHGYMMSSFGPLRLFAEPLARQGIDIYYLALPYHLDRAPLGTWSGQLGLSSDVLRTINSFRQGVMDVRSLISYIHEERNQPVMLVGLSLGGFTCSMATVVDNRPAGLINLLGGANLADIVFAGNSFYLIRRSLLKNGIDQAALNKYWAGLSPGNFRSILPREKTLMVAGLYDPIITPQNTTTLWHAWDEPEIAWLPCGHASLSFYAREVGRLVHQAVNSWLGDPEQDQEEVSPRIAVTR